MKIRFKKKKKKDQKTKKTVKGNFLMAGVVSRSDGVQGQ